MAPLFSPERLLANVESYGLPAFAVVLLLGAIGLPLPCTMVLVATGALVRIGLFDWHVVIVLALVVTVVGDATGYWLGRWGAGPFARSARWEPARQTFQRWGAAAIVLTRFLLTPLALPTNLVAGSSRYRFGRFLLFDTAGELVWVVTYAGLGFVFADRWETVHALVGQAALPTGLTVAAVLLALWGLPALLPKRTSTNEATSVMRPTALTGD